MQVTTLTISATGQANAQHIDIPVTAMGWEMQARSVTGNNAFRVATEQAELADGGNYWSSQRLGNQTHEYVRCEQRTNVSRRTPLRLYVAVEAGSDKTIEVRWW